jgi:hypothetical protein
MRGGALPAVRHDYDSLVLLSPHIEPTSAHHGNPGPHKPVLPTLIGLLNGSQILPRVRKNVKTRCEGFAS